MDKHNLDQSAHPCSFIKFLRACSDVYNLAATTTEDGMLDWDLVAESFGVTQI
jgi:hypothetical protein